MKLGQGAIDESALPSAVDGLQFPIFIEFEFHTVDVDGLTFLRDRYFQTAHAYYGDNFDRDAFERILSQLRAEIVLIPELAARLEETTNLGAGVQVSSPVRVSGLHLKAIYWNGYLQKWKQQLTEKITVRLGPLDSEKARAKVQAILDSYGQRTAAFLEQHSSMNKTQAAKAAGDYYTSLRDPDFEAAAAFVYFHIMNDPVAVKLLGSDDADVVLVGLHWLTAQSTLNLTSVTVPESAHVCCTFPLRGSTTAHPSPEGDRRNRRGK